MRHQVSGRHLGRTSAHRRALRRNLAASLFEHGTISTTVEKAKFVKPFAEELITLARDGSLHARRRAIALLGDRAICKIEDGEPTQVETVINKLFKELGPRFADRQGGYTRIIRLPLRRIGDNGQLVLLQLVGDQKVTGKRHAAAQTPPVEPAQLQEEVSVEALPEATDTSTPAEPESSNDAGKEKTAEDVVPDNSAKD